MRDGSAEGNKVVKGYHVAEAVVISEKMKQPISLSSHIYSSTSKGFISTNDVTLKTIAEVKEVIKQKSVFVFDRGYDANVYYKKFLEEMEDDFIIRVKSNRNLLFKGKSKNDAAIAKQRKGKYKMELWFDNNRKKSKEIYMSHTKVELPLHKGKILYLVIVYGLSEEERCFY